MLINKDVVHIYNGILLSHKKNEILPFATTWMNLKGIMLSEISQQKTNSIYIPLICGIYTTSKYKKKTADSQIQRTNQWLPVRRGKGEGQYRGTGLRGTNY